MKHLKDILAEKKMDLPHHGRDKAVGEKEFKKKHTDNIQDSPYPAKGTDDVLNARSMKKDTSKPTHKTKEEEEAMYEEAAEDLPLDIFEQLVVISENEETMLVTFDDGQELEVDPETADALLACFEELSDDNSEYFLGLLESSDSFIELVDFANEAIEEWK